MTTNQARPFALALLLTAVAAALIILTATSAGRAAAQSGVEPTVSDNGRVSWTPVRNAEAYTVRWTSDGNRVPASADRNMPGYGSAWTSANECSPGECHAQIAEFDASRYYLVEVRAHIIITGDWQRATYPDSGTTGPEPVIAAMTGLYTSPSNIDPTTAINVFWDLVPKAGHYALSWSTGSARAGGKSHHVTGLRPGVSYTFTVQAVGSDGTVLAQGQVSGRTDASIPDVGLNVSPLGISLDEGATATYQVWLNAAPRNRVTVEISSNSNAVSLSESRLTFDGSNWSYGQTVTVTAASNNVMDEADRAVIIKNLAQGTGMNTQSAFVNVTVTEVDFTPVRPTGISGVTVAEHHLFHDTLVVSWNPVGSANSHQVRYKAENATEYGHDNIIMSAGTGEIRGLTPGTAYDVSVQALAANGSVIAETQTTGTTKTEVAIGIEMERYTEFRNTEQGMRLTINEGYEGHYRVRMTGTLPSSAESNKYTVTPRVYPAGSAALVELPDALEFDVHNWRGYQFVNVKAVDDGVGTAQTHYFTINHRLTVPVGITTQGNRVLIGFAVMRNQTLCYSHFRRLNRTSMSLALADLEPNITDLRYREGGR